MEIQTSGQHALPGAQLFNAFQQESYSGTFAPVCFFRLTAAALELSGEVSEQDRLIVGFMRELGSEHVFLQRKAALEHIVASLLDVELEMSPKFKIVDMWIGCGANSALALAELDLEFLLLVEPVDRAPTVLALSADVLQVQLGNLLVSGSAVLQSVHAQLEARFRTDYRFQRDARGFTVTRESERGSFSFTLVVALRTLTAGQYVLPSPDPRAQQRGHWHLYNATTEPRLAVKTDTRLALAASLCCMLSRKHGWALQRCLIEHAVVCAHVLAPSSSVHALAVAALCALSEHVDSIAVSYFGAIERIAVDAETRGNIRRIADELQSKCGVELSEFLISSGPRRAPTSNDA
jgi:hypothetical protein